MISFSNGFDIDANVTEAGRRWGLTNAHGTYPWALATGRQGGGSKCWKSPSGSAAQNYLVQNIAVATIAESWNVVVGFAFKYTSIAAGSKYKLVQMATGPSTGRALGLSLSSAGILEVYTNETGYDQFLVGAGDTLWKTCSGHLEPDRWYYIELKEHNNQVTVFVDDVEVGSVFSVTGSLLVNCSQVVFCGPEQAATDAGEYCLFDDIYCVVICGLWGAQDRLGPVIVQGCLPTGAGSENDWDLMDATTRPTCVNDADDTTGVKTAADGEYELFAFTPNIPSDAEIHGVQIVLHGNNTDPDVQHGCEFAMFDQRAANKLSSQDGLIHAFGYPDTDFRGQSLVAEYIDALATGSTSGQKFTPDDLNGTGPAYTDGFQFGASYIV